MFQGIPTFIGAISIDRAVLDARGEMPIGVSLVSISGSYYQDIVVLDMFNYWLEKQRLFKGIIKWASAGELDALYIDQSVGEENYTLLIDQSYYEAVDAANAERKRQAEAEHKRFIPLDPFVAACVREKNRRARIANALQGRIKSGAIKFAETLLDAKEGRDEKEKGQAAINSADPAIDAAACAVEQAALYQKDIHLALSDLTGFAVVETQSNNHYNPARLNGFVGRY